MKQQDEPAGFWIDVAAVCTLTGVGYLVGGPTYWPIGVVAFGGGAVVAIAVGVLAKRADRAAKDVAIAQGNLTGEGGREP